MHNPCTFYAQTMRMAPHPRLAPTPTPTGTTCTTTTGGGVVTGALFKYKLHDQRFYFPPVQATATAYSSAGSAQELKTDKGVATGIYVFMDLADTDVVTDIAAGDPDGARAAEMTAASSKQSG